ncbi:MAG: DUF1585 domain-containing protein, partial [Myxococcota bacterium]|nr:DUF1585 domain-containing protein [Myxococcota bacterium]
RGPCGAQAQTEHFVELQTRILPTKCLDRRGTLHSDGVFVHPRTLETTHFSSLTELSAVLASDPTVRACVVRQLLQFAYGDLLHGTGDACIQAAIVADTGTEASFRQVVRAIALHPSYRRISP